VELVKVMASVLPVSPWREERLRQVSHVSLTDRVETHSIITDLGACEHFAVGRSAPAATRPGAF